MNLSSFIMRSGLALHSEVANDNPDLHPDEIPEDCEHYLCSLRGRTHEMEFHFTCGPGDGPPAVHDALRYLGAVAVEFEACDDLEEWAQEFELDAGDMDTRNAYAAVARLTRDLWRLLGDELYNELVRDVEIEQAVEIACSSVERTEPH